LLWKLFSKDDACAVGFVVTLSMLIVLIVSVIGTLFLIISMIGMFVDILLMLWDIISWSLHHSLFIFKNVSICPSSFKTTGI
jgi:hypothetical protein